MEDVGTVVALVSHYDGVTTNVSASLNGRYILIKIHTCQTIINIKAGETWRNTRLAKLIRLIGIRQTGAYDAI